MRIHPLALLAAGLVLLPLLLRTIGLPWSSASEIAIFILVGLGFNLLIGYTGLVSFGHGMFFGLAAYGMALTQIHFMHGQLVLPLLSGVAVATFAGAVVGFFALRRRGVYFSLLTLAFTVLTFYTVFRWTALTGGENGLSGIDRGSLLGLDLGNQTVFYVAVAVVVFVSACGVWRLVNSPFGTVLQAIRENEQRASFVGYPVQRYKYVAFVLSALLVGIGGAMMALLKQFVSADLTHVNFSGEILAMSVIGGIGGFLGPAVGAVFYILFREILSEFTTAWQFWFGLLFMGFVLFSPSGLIGLGARILGLIRGRRGDGQAHSQMQQQAALADTIPPVLLSRVRERGTEPLLVAEQVTKRFGAFTAVKAASIDVRAGQIRALIGPNGAGKTTLFNMLSGMFPPDEGRVRLLGREVNGLAPEAMVSMGLARSFQITNLFRALTVRENLRLAVQARHPNRFDLWRRASDAAEVERETEAILDYVGLRPIAENKPESLSYGGQRLLEIAIALCAAPAVLLLDEPLVGLAPAERDRIIALIRKLSVHLGVLIVEHDIDRVFAFADRITVMSNGAVLTDGDVEHVRGHEEVQRVYLGSGRSAVVGSRGGSVSAPQGEIVLQLKGVHTYYGESHILRGLDIEVRANAVTALLGRNGAGKTTTFGSIMGLAPARMGEIVFEGQRIEGLGPERIARMGIGLVPQGRRLFTSLTVAENLKVGGLMRRSGSGVRWDMERILEIFPRLRERIDNRADRLSGGEQQMVAIARALSGHVKVLLLDEPFEGLAPAIIEELFHAIDLLRRELTVVIVEHDLDLVLALADHVYALDRGEITYRGEPQRLRDDIEYRKQVLWV